MEFSDAETAVLVLRELDFEALEAVAIPEIGATGEWG